MLLQTSEIKSLVGHTYNRPEFANKETNKDVVESLIENILLSLEDKDTLVMGKVARSSWGDTRDLVSTFTKTLQHC